MNTGKFYFIPEWLLQQNSQTIHAYLFILNKINENSAEFKTSSIQISKELNISRQQARLILEKITTKEPGDNYKITNKTTSKNTVFSIDFVGVKDYANKPIKKQEPKKQQSTILPIQKRKENFIDDLKKYTNLYDKDLLNDFYRYWGETDPKETKMRFEFQKTWDLNLRLGTFKRNALKKFNKINPTKPQEQKIGRTSIETIKKNAEYNGKY